MKRSEMLSYMKHKIYLSVSSMSDANDLAEELSEELLDMMENLGMKPKGYHGVMASGKKYNPDTDQGRDVEYFHNWEPEDEA